MEQQKQQIDPTLLKNLQSDDETVVASAVETIKAKGNSAYIEPLFEVIQTSANAETQRTVKRILADIKPAESVQILMDLAQNPKYKNIPSDIISVCWESGLDFSNHIPTFINWIVNGEYMVAFEAFTVIENIEKALPIADVEDYLKPVFEAIDQAPEDRKVLLEAVVSHLRMFAQ
jgi:hypothetical protein